MNIPSIKKFLIGVFLLTLTCAISYADTPSGTVHKFGEWAQGIVTFFEQIKTFVQIVATVVGMWFVYSALQLFRKHHTTQGTQGEHVKHGAGHLVLGVFLMCLVPAIQMLQGTISKNMGQDGATKTFEVQDENIFSK